MKKNKTFILFLDFDGVVNTLQYSDKLGHIGYHFPNDGSVNNRTAIEWLNMVYKKYPYHIVFTTSWRRKLSKLELMEILYNSGLNKSILSMGNTPIDKGYGWRRGEEITTWIKEHSDINIAPCILDDEKYRGCSYLDKCFVQVENCTVGVTYLEKEKIEFMFKYWGSHDFSLN